MTLTIFRRLQPFSALAGVWVFLQPAAAQQQQPAPEVLEYKATVAPARQAEVAPRLDGLLSKINFKAGQRVTQGDLLFEFGTKDKELTLALAQAALKQAEAQLRLRSEEHTSELQSRQYLVCRLLLEKKKYRSRLPPPVGTPPSLALRSPPARLSPLTPPIPYPARYYAVSLHPHGPLFHPLLPVATLA